MLTNLGITLYLVLSSLIVSLAIIANPEDSFKVSRQHRGDHHRSKRVIGGSNYDEGRWPWLVSLQGKIPERMFMRIPLSYRTFYCGASLVNERWLLTAAHCFTDNQLGSRALTPKYWHARTGEIQLRRTHLERVRDFIGKVFDRSDLRHYHIHAKRIVIHPDYNSGEMWTNDIALVELEEALPVSEADNPAIQSVSLINANNRSFPTDGQNCVMKGWGCIESGGGVAGTARQVNMSKIGDGDCWRFWGIETTSRLCAGTNTSAVHRGICSGDSGGPLVCYNGVRWVQVGVASFTSASRPETVPGVFTRVSNYVTWIRDVIAN